MTLRGTSAPPLIGRYEILQELGRGAMGVVFKARDPFIGRLVAVKTITADIADNQDFLERFRREAQAAGGLQHPNIVTIYEMAEFEGTPFIAMEYLEGESLEKKIDVRARLPLVHKLGYLVQTCRALDYAHRRGVIHRDVKPANIVLTTESVVKVVDFGIARIVDTSKTQTGMMLGTLSYMAPEQISGKPADQRCDVWALGVVMYELLTYRLPFDGDNHAALLMAILQNEPRPVREIVPECPPALEDIVLRALRKNPGERYQTMEALLVDLEPIWSSTQRDAVQKLVNHGRELMESGRLEEASAVLRKSLSLDTGNTAVKALYDQVSAMLGGSPGPAEGSQTSAGDEARRTMPDLGSKGGLSSATTRLDPMATRAMEPARAPSGASSASAPPARGGRAAETIFVSPLPAAQRSDAPKPSATAKLDAARSTRPGPASPAAPRAAISKPAPTPGTSNVGYVAAGIFALLLVGAAAYWKLAPRPTNPAEQAAVTPPARSSGPATSPAQSLPGAAPPSTSGAPANDVPAPLAASVEDQQRHLVDLAHEAADAKDFKTAQARLDEAARLNGPLNPLIKDLRHEFSEDAHGAELRQLATREQSLWDRSMKAVAAGEWDDAEQLLREILTLPEVNRHWAEAARYVDETIPERKKEKQLWSSEQLEAGLTGPDHRLNEVKLLDQILALGGPHQQEARQRRDTVMDQFARNTLRKNNNEQGSDRLESQAAKLAPLKDEFDKALAQGDAQALEQLQAVRPKFKAIVDAGGLRVYDARDYFNNLIPRAQKAIEDRLASRETNSTQNAEYRNAMKHFDQAVATQNGKLLRGQVQPEFEKIATSGGPRAPEAQRYVSELIPAALRKNGRTAAETQPR